MADEIELIKLASILHIFVFAQWVQIIRITHPDRTTGLSQGEMKAPYQSLTNGQSCKQLNWKIDNLFFS